MDALVTAAHANLPAPHPNMAAVFMCPSIKICACTLAYPVTIPLLLKYIAAEPAWNVQLILWMTLLGISNRKTSNVLTTKADLFLAGIVQLLCVLLAHKLHDLKLARRPRKLIAWFLSLHNPSFCRLFQTALFLYPVLLPYFSLMLICFFSSSFAIT